MFAPAGRGRAGTVNDRAAIGVPRIGLACDEVQEFGEDCGAQPRNPRDIGGTGVGVSGGSRTPANPDILTVGG